MGRGGGWETKQIISLASDIKQHLCTVGVVLGIKYHGTTQYGLSRFEVIWLNIVF